MVATRTVRTLRLVSDSEESIGRGRLLVEDAFRVADFPRCRGRLLVVRRVSLGRIDPARPSVAVATRLEAAVEEAGGRAVRFDDPGAGGADAVYFPDETSPPVARLLQVVSGRPADEWFWPLVLPPGTQSGPDRSVTIRALVLAAAASMEAGALVQLMHALRRSGRLDQVLQSLQPGDGAELVAALTGGTTVAVSPDLRVLSPPEWAPVLEARARQWGAADLRLLWLAAVALVHQRPGMLRHPDLRAHASALSLRLGVAAARTPIPQPPRKLPPADVLNDHDTGSRAVNGALGERAASPERPEQSQAPAEGLPPVEEARASPAAAHGAPLPEPASDVGGDLPATLDQGYARLEEDGAEAIRFPPDLRAMRSEYGGFFFLIRVLNYLGLEDVLAASPRLLEWDFARYTLRELGRRARIPKDDPSVLALGLDELGPPPANEDLRSMVRTWSANARRWCRSGPRLSLRYLVRRDAWILTTATHVDAVFDLRATDLRVRRAGLDSDPGWVPWLGRVVTYHYLEGGYRGPAAGD